MAIEIGLPVLEARQFDDGDRVDRMLADLRGEIATLERDLADVEAAIADAEQRVGPWIGRPGSEESAIRAVAELLDGWLGGERAATRAATEDPALRTATLRILEARKHAERTTLRGQLAPPLEEVAVDLQAPDDDADASRTAADHLSERIAAACQRALRDVTSPDSSLDVPTSEAVEDADSRSERHIADVEHAEAAFEAFWREEHVASTSGRSLLRPLDALVPMALLVALLALVLLFV